MYRLRFIHPIYIVIIAIILSIIFVKLVNAQDESSLIFGKASTGVMTWENSSGSPADSVTNASMSTNAIWDITVISGSSDSAGICTLSYINGLTRERYTVIITAGSKDTTRISGCRICYNDTLSTGNRLRIEYSDKIAAKIDTVGGVFEAQWESAYVDTVTTVSATPDTILLSSDYPQGLTVLADANLQFRTNRITGWVFLASGSSTFIPIRHSTSDTFFVKSATIPDVVLVRGK